MNPSSSYDVFMAVLTFSLSVCAAALAINLYSLLRTGRMGASWRVIIIATVMFALLQAVRLAEVMQVPMAAALHLSSVIELTFVITLLYAFHLQRQVFAGSNRSDEPNLLALDPPEDEEEPAVSAYDRYS